MSDISDIEEPRSVVQGLRRTLPLVLIFAVVGVLILEARHINLRSVQHDLAAVPPGHLLLLGCGGLIASGAMALYDLIAAPVIGYRRKLVAGLQVGVIASGINNVVSLSGLTGSGLRVLLLTGDGVESAAAVRYAGLVATTSALGLSALALVTLIVRPSILSLTLVPLWMVMASLAVLACYLPLYLILAMTPLLRIGRLAAVERLTPTQALAFVGASICEWLLAATVLWGCIGALGLSLAPTTVVAAFVLAATLGTLSFLPGGLGVFDATLAGLLITRGATTEIAVAVLVLFRVAYYLVPLIAALFLGANALARSRLATTLREHPLVSVLAWPVGRAVDLGLRLLSALTAGAGIVLLGGSAFPNLLSHTRLLAHWVPLPAVEATQLASVVVGLTLIMTARGLSLRLRQSLWWSIGLLIAGAVFGLTRGLDWGTSLLLIVVSGLLYISRASFDRHGSIARHVGAWPWTATLVAALVGYLLLGHALYRGHPIDPLTFGFGTHAPRFARGAFVALISVIVLVIWTWPRWPTPRLARPTAADLDALVTWLETNGSNAYSHLMLLGDKTLRYCADDRALIGYGAIRNRLVALSDPAGPPAARRAAIGEFRQLADDMQCTPVFYQVSPDDLSAYLDHGFALFKLGEIARVDLEAFSMSGRRNADKRGALNRASRLGLTFDLVAPPFDDDFFTHLAQVSDDWLGEKPAEKMFSLGAFDRDYLARAPIAVVHDAERRLIAFASILPSYGHREEYSIDLMRHVDDAPGGTMDFLFVRLMQEAQAAGYRWFSLGMAPLAGVGDTPWARPAEQLARLAFEHGNRFYNYKGLRAFKDKWDPVWHSMYLAYPPETRLSSLQLDIAALIAGGYRRILGDNG